MKILAYTENYATETLTFIVNELKEVEKNHDLLLVYSNRINPHRNELKKMVQVPFTYNRLINKLRWWLEQSQMYFALENYKFRKGLNKCVSEFKPELIHCHFGTDFLKVIVNLSPEYAKVPILISFYGFDVTERICNKAVLKQYQKYMALTNVHSIAVSKNLVEKVNTYIKPRHKSELLHSGIDTSFFKRKRDVEKTAGEFVFLQVASFYQKKGHFDTLQVFKKFVESDRRFKYKFIIAGFGPLEKAIKSQIESLGLKDHVTMIGPVTPLQMVDLGSRADCFVHMSIRSDNGEEEGLPNVLLEAMSLELPILSTRHAGIPEIIVDGENGILADEKNHDQYLEGFKKIVSWKPLAKNRERIVQMFGMESHMNAIEDLYNSITKH